MKIAIHVLTYTALIVLAMFIANDVGAQNKKQDFPLPMAVGANVFTVNENEPNPNRKITDLESVVSSTDNTSVPCHGLWVESSGKEGWKKAAAVSNVHSVGPTISLYDYTKNPMDKGAQFAVALDSDGKPYMQISVAGKVQMVDLVLLAEMVEDYKLKKDLLRKAAKEQPWTVK